jgi:hypothetical protein
MSQTNSKGTITAKRRSAVDSAYLQSCARGLSSGCALAPGFRPHAPTTQAQRARTMDSDDDSTRSLSPVPALRTDYSAHFHDLDPVVTYKHLHSRTLGPNDPLRCAARPSRGVSRFSWVRFSVIALVDSDAFYAQAESVLRSVLRAAR